MQRSCGGSFVLKVFCDRRSKFCVFFSMASTPDFNRKVMVFSVSVLGLSLATFLFAYMVYGDNTDEDLRTLRQTNVSRRKIKVFLIIDI